LKKAFQVEHHFNLNTQGSLLSNMNETAPAKNRIILSAINEVQRLYGIIETIIAWRMPFDFKAIFCKEIPEVTRKMG
jgi:hypothetical protein